MKIKKPSHRWKFKKSIKPNVFNWKSSSLACKRLKEAQAEIRSVAKADSRTAAWGIADLSERIWPAFKDVDSSSGSLGTAVYNVLKSLVPIFSSADLIEFERNELLDRIFIAVEDDGVDYLAPLGDAWGELCATQELALKWATHLSPQLIKTWSDLQKFSYFSGTTACLSSLLKAQEYKGLKSLIDLCPVKMWAYQKYQFYSLVNQGKKAEALRYAQTQLEEINQPVAAINEACEQVLLSAGLYEEAYKQFGLHWTERQTNLATFRAIAKKYPQMSKKTILLDLVAENSGQEGKWYATAKELGELELATQLAQKSPCDPKTLIRAAKKFLESEGQFSLDSGLAALKWMCDGYGYQISNLDAVGAYLICIEAAKRLGKVEQTKIAIENIIRHGEDAAFIEESLKNLLGVRDKTDV